MGQAAKHIKAKSMYLSCAAVLTVTQPLQEKDLILINYLPFLSLLSPGLGKCQLNTSQRTKNRPNGWSPNPKVTNSLSLMTGGRLKLSTFFWSSSSGWMSSSGPVEQREFLGLGVAFFSLTWSWTNSLVKHQHTLRNKISRGNGRIHHLKQPLKYNAHVTCQCRHSRNVLTKALRNIHCHCSTGFMKSEVLHLRHSLQETIYPYKDLEKPKQKKQVTAFYKCAISRH